MNFGQRLLNYFDRSRQLSPYLSPALAAPVFFAARHFMPHLLFRGQYQGHRFYARNIDYSAIREIIFEKDYEYLRPFLKANSKPTILDLGAHIGMFSLWVLGQCPKAEIFSVEASPDTFSILERTNQAAVRDSDIRWNVLHRAAWKDDSSISFSSSGDAMSHQVNQQGDIKVQGISLGMLLQMVGKPIDLMKVDIEGAEEAFLCNNAHLLQNVERVVIELHAKYCNTKNVRDMLESVYPIVSEVQGRTSSKVVLYCRRRDDE